MSSSSTAPVFAVDEVGRGCLWGPVVAGAVVLPASCPENSALWDAIRDSKKVSERKRPVLAEYIKRIALAHGVGYADVDEIDSVNILQATMRAMHRAIDAAWRDYQHKHPGAEQPAAVLVDGPNFVPYMPPGVDVEPLDHECIVDGDDSVKGIAAASILAKVERDDWVVRYVSEQPALKAYQIDKNKGYGTAAHMGALKTHGIHELHRRSFAPCARVIGLVPASH